MSSVTYPGGCSADETQVFFETPVGGPECGTWSNYDDANIDCICKKPSGAGSGGGDPADKVCIDVRKKKACKSLSYCNYDRDSSPMCTDVTPGAKIPIKEFCEVIPTRGWCM